MDLLPKRKYARTGTWVLAIILGTGIGAPAGATSSVQSAPTSEATVLPLDGEGFSTERIIKVADVYVTSDAPRGFTLTVSSGSISKSDAQTPVPFQVVTVADTAGPPNTADFSTPSGAAYTFTTATQGDANRQLYIRYIAARQQDPGAYSAALTLTVSDN